jgi:hypothetical protein
MKKEKVPRTYQPVSTTDKGLGPDSAGQSGDTQGLSGVAEATSEASKSWSKRDNSRGRDRQRD